MSIYRRGTIFWCDITDPAGKRIKRSLGTPDREAAQELHDKLKHELWRVHRLGEKPRRTWEEACLRWLDESADKRTLGRLAKQIENYSAYFGGRYIDSLTADEIHAATKAITGGRVYYNRHLALMRAILLRAMKHWQWIDRVPALVLEKEAKRRVRYLTALEAQRLLDELPEHQRDVVILALHTGLRQGNVLGLRWDQVDMVRRLVVIDGDEMKNAHAHGVPLNDSAAAVIRKQVGKHLTHVFTYRGKPIGQANTKAWRAALKRAGIVDFRWHDLRHCFASWLIQQGVPLAAIQELGGWQSSQMVRRYAHLSRDHLAEYVGKLDGTNTVQRPGNEKTA